MNRSLQVTLLGTGTSHGVPMIGCDCRVCRSDDPRDKRLRPSILVELGDRTPSPRGAAASLDAASSFAQSVRTILVDTSTDLRAQALTHDIRRVDAILFTHSHADHVMGLDEVRRFNVVQRAAIPCFGDAPTMEDLRRIFPYIFATPRPVGGGVPHLSLFTVGGPFLLGGVDVVPVPIFHGPRPILGFRIGDFAYLTDCSRIPDESWPLVAGVRVLVLDALRDRPHPTHFSVSEALEAVARIRPERTLFTHICHDLAHAETCARLPAGVELAYDGLVVRL